jgi:hypothetical protein
MYYIFEIKDEIMTLYKDNPNGLFKVLNHIYYMHVEDVTYGFNLFNQIIYPTNVNEMNRKIYLKLHRELVYSKQKNEHIINNLYKDEISILKIGNSHLLLECNKNYSSFFKLLEGFNKNYFVCDFKEQDYFFLKDIKSLV